jgi:predicted ferric reductase
MTILDVCAYLGLAAVGTATVNMLLGLLIALRYSPVRLWPHRQMNIFRLHNLTAYLVLLLIVLHPAVLLLTWSTHFAWGDVLLPIHSPVQPRLNTVGAVSLYVLLVVIFTLPSTPAHGSTVVEKAPLPGISGVRADVLP